MSTSLGRLGGRFVARSDDPALPRRTPRGSWPVAAAALVLVFLLSLVAVTDSPSGSAVAAWWPAAGIASGLLAVSPSRRVPVLVGLVAVATGVANLIGGRSVVVSAGFGLANAAEALVVVAVLSAGFRRAPRLDTLAELARLVLATAAGAVTAGVLAGLTVLLAADASALTAARTVASAHAASQLLVVPLVLGALSWRREPREAGRAEAVAQLLVAALVVLLVFGPGQQLPLTSLPIPLLVWAGLRLRPLEAVVEMLVIGAVASVATLRDAGPFGSLGAAGVIDQQLVATLTQNYLAVLALVTLPLVIAVRSRRRVLAVMEAGRDLYRRGVNESVVGTMLLRPGDDGLVVIEVNEPAAALLGTPVESLRGRTWVAGLPDDEVERLRQVRDQLHQGLGGSWEREVELTGVPLRWVRLALSWVPGGPGGGLVTAQLVDLTESRRSRTALRHERDFSASVLDTTDALILVADTSLGIVRANAAVERLTGLDAEDLVGQPLWNTGIDPRCVAGVRAAVEEAPGGGRRILGEHDWVTRQGRRFTLRWTCAHQPGGPWDTAVVLTGIDVTSEHQTRGVLEAVLHSTTGVSIIGTDAAGVITFFNVGAEELLGYRADELVGRATLARFHDLDELEARAEELGIEPGFDALVGEVRRTRRPERRDWTYVRRDGERITVSVTVGRAASVGDPTPGFLAVAMDVTERQETQQALEIALDHQWQAVERLRELNQIKSDFVASVSHELRTPLTSVIGFAQLLQTGEAGTLAPHQQHLVERVSRNGRRLQVLIEDLLTISRIEAGALVLHRAEVDLRDVVAASVESVADLREDREVDLRVPLGAGPPVVVWGDADQLERVVTNLLSNAVKFTPDGGAVSVETSTDDETVVLSITDTGVGIETHELSRLFEKFFRASSAARRDAPGTGLGLSIVRSLVEAHEGTVEVSSVLDRGTTVRVCLPRRP